MSTSNTCIMTVNGGSSSIKFALFEAKGDLRRILAGRIEGIGLSEGTFSVKATNTPGENAPEVRTRTCQGLDWIGIQLDEHRDRANEPVISHDSSRVTVRMIRTEECIIAQMVCQVLGIKVAH